MDTDKEKAGRDMARVWEKRRRERAVGESEQTHGRDAHATPENKKPRRMRSGLGELFQRSDEIVVLLDEGALRALGGNAVGTLTEFLKLTRLSEHPGQDNEARQMIENLLADHESIIRNLRAAVDSCTEEYRDVGTSDFLTGLMEDHEKMAWMLRSFLR